MSGSDCSLLVFRPSRPRQLALRIRLFTPSTSSQTLLQTLSSLSFASGLFCFAFLSLCTTDVRAQVVDSLAQGQAPPDTTQSDVPQVQDGAVRVFLDCDRCDFSYIRREIPFVNYVRDRQQAGVHVLVTNRPTGGGGREFVLNFIGLGPFEEQDAVLTYSSPSYNTDDDERRGMARILKIGLLPYVARSPLSALIAVSYREEEASELRSQSEPVDDPWNSWVFDVGLGGSFDAEERQNRYSVEGEFSADRITEAWRIRTEAEVDYDERNFKQTLEDDDGEPYDSTFTSTSEDRSINASAVRSLNRRWSAGLFTSATYNTRVNRDLGLRLAPAIEYSIFPYSQADRKELTLAYYAGIYAVDYIQETVFRKTSETLLYQSLQLRLNITQPWGGAFVSLRGSNYFHDLTKNRLDFYGTVSVRLFKGLSARVRLSAERIRDQLFLPRGDADLIDLLLRRQQLATGYQFSGSLGISYTFGSIYNNVVNTRL